MIIIPDLPDVQVEEVEVAFEYGGRDNSEEKFGRGKSEGKFGRIGQTFLPFAQTYPKQKETGRCPGGNTTGVPR